MPAAKVNPIYLLIDIANTPEIDFREHAAQYRASIVEADDKGFWTPVGCDYDYLDTKSGKARNSYYKNLLHSSSLCGFGHSNSTLRFGYDRRFNETIRQSEAEAMFLTLKRLERRIEEQYQRRGELEGLGGSILRWAFALKVKGIFVQGRFKDRALPLDLTTAAKLNQLFDSVVAECKIMDEKPIESVVIALTEAVNPTYDHPYTRTLVVENNTRLVEIPFADSAWENQVAAWRKSNYCVDVVNVQKAAAYA